MIEVKDAAGNVTNYTEAEYIAARDSALVAWEASKKALEVAKETELEARKLAVMFLHDPSQSGHMETVELGNGYKAKTKTPINYSFVKSADGTKIDKARIDKALAKIEKDGEVGELIAERLVKWTPALSLTEYNLLNKKYREIIDDVIVTTEGTPTLEIVEPKAKK